MTVISSSDYRLVSDSINIINNGSSGRLLDLKTSDRPLV